MKSKKSLAYESLKEKIINGILKQGEFINEIFLSQELRTSKTPVREALQQLEKDGFIECHHGKGFFVSKISIQDLRELFDLRNILETEIAKRAAILAKPEQIERAKRKFQSQEKEGKQQGGSLQAGDGIHKLVFEIYGNQKLNEIYSRLQEHIVRARIHLTSGFDSERSEESIQEHLEILEGLAARDPVRTEKAVRTHLQKSMDYQWAILKSRS